MAAANTTSTPARSSLVSSVISSILSLVIFGCLRFYAEWFATTQMNTIFGGFLASWLFIFSLTSVSNIEMLIFGNDFQVKFVPEIVFCLVLAVIAAGVVHRVCATTCILFCIIGLFFVNRISTRYHQKGATSIEPVSFRKAGGKKNKQN